MGRTMSDHGKALLAEWEGIRLHVYKDSADHQTIGVGHLVRYDEERRGEVRIGARWVPYVNGLSREDAMALLGEDLRWAENVVDQQVKVDLAQHQFDALVSFAFNVGSGRFIESSLLRRVNALDLSVVPDEFRKWTNTGGSRVVGLVNRRAHEVALWEGRL